VLFIKMKDDGGAKEAEAEAHEVSSSTCTCLGGGLAARRSLRRPARLLHCATLSQDGDGDGEKPVRPVGIDGYIKFNGGDPALLVKAALKVDPKATQGNTPFYTLLGSMMVALMLAANLLKRKGWPSLKVYYKTINKIFIENKKEMCDNMVKDFFIAFPFLAKVLGANVVWGVFKAVSTKYNNWRKAHPAAKNKEFYQSVGKGDRTIDADPSAKGFAMLKAFALEFEGDMPFKVPAMKVNMRGGKPGREADKLIPKPLLRGTHMQEFRLRQKEATKKKANRYFK